MSEYQRESAQAELMPQGDIAIVGMACLFPGAPDLTTCWYNITSKFDAITDPPPEAWDADTFYSLSADTNDRVYCKRGGYLGPIAMFNPLRHGVMPAALEGSEPDQWLALEVARAAFQDAGYGAEIPERYRTATIIGKGTYLNRGNLTAAQHGQVVDQTLTILHTLHPEYSEDEIQRIRRELKRCLPPFNADTAPGLIPNVMVGRIANRLDLMGPSYTIDAACASSLIAVDIARRELLTRRCDLALVGGVHVVTPVPVLMLFCQLGALSRREQIRPFDQAADGTLLSEGIGMIILKRRADAERDGNRIYALVKGVGVASDGRALSVLAPRVEGEELALRLAYEQAGIPPETVGLIEAHGTATLIGDATELQALTRVLGARAGELPRVALGSIKSMIGHTMPASGMAGLIKTALALYHKTLPPTLHVDQPSQRLELDKTPFYINTETRPWIHGTRTVPRRAGVNAFGFGGINAHVVLEEFPLPEEHHTESCYRTWESELCVVQGESRAELVHSARRLMEFVQAAPDICLKDLAYTLNLHHTTLHSKAGLRIAIVASTLPELQRKLDKALQRLADPDCHKIKDRSGIFFWEQPLARTGKLAFLFPGEGAQYVNMLADLCLHFPQVRSHFDAMDRVFEHHARGYRPSDCIFPPPAFSDQARAEQACRIWQMDVAIEALVTANHALYTLLDELGIQPDVMLGHSTGEFSAMRASGMLQVEGYERHLLELNHRYTEVAAQGGIPEATLLAIGAGREQVELLLAASTTTLFIALDNCPHQTIVAGSHAAIDQAQKLATARGFLCERLAFNRAYHTPLYAPYAEVVRQIMTEWIVAPPAVPLYSCTTARLLPTDLAEARRIAHEHWLAPVEFRRTIEQMYDDGVRLFVEVGPRGNLSAFVEDILRGRPAVVVPADIEHRSGLTQLNYLLGMLAAHGVPMRLDPLYVRRAPRQLDLAYAADPLHQGKPTGTRVKLATGWPPMVISQATADLLRERVDARTLTRAADQLWEHAAGTAPAPTPTSPDLAGGNHHHSIAYDPPPTLTAPVVPSGDDTGQPGPTLAATCDTAIPSSMVAPSTAAEPPPSAEAASIVSAYLQTMEQFLSLQEDVMTAFLRGNPVPGAMSSLHPPPISATSPSAATTNRTEPSSAIMPRDAAAGTETLVKPGNNGLDHSTLGNTMLRIVSDKTGYPPAMLDLNLDLEADLGIDSIKRVEILGEFQQETGIRIGNDMDQLSAHRKLHEILDFLIERDTAARATSAGTADHAQAPPDMPETRPILPFIREVVELTAGQSLVAGFTVSLATCPFLRDHTLGRHVSQLDQELTGLPVMPLTMSMEILAEAAATLLPDRRLLGMKQVRASRWVTLDKEPIRLRINAQCLPSGEEVHVQIHEPGIAAPIVEGIVSVGADFPPAPIVSALNLTDEMPGTVAREQLYEEAMFHGPAFRGVCALDRLGADGAEAELVTLPPADVLPGYDLLTDPVLLDQPGQIVGFWAAQVLPTGSIVFPYRFEALRLYGPALAAGQKLICQARIALRGEHQTRADLSIIRPDGQVWAEFAGWEDRRFDLPRSFYDLLLTSQKPLLAKSWPELTMLLPESGNIEAYTLGMDAFPDGFLTSHGEIWQKVLVHLQLSQRERSLWHGLNMPAPRRLEWLLSRIAAKDAGRAYLQRRYGLKLNPADVEILPDAHGQLTFNGAWVANLPETLSLALASAGEFAVALVGDGNAGKRIGLDVELTIGISAGMAHSAGSAHEQALLTSIPDETRESWAARFYSAKKAVSKALGNHMIDDPQALIIQQLEPTSGTLTVKLPDAAGSADLTAEPMYITAYTLCHDELIIAAAVSREKEIPDEIKS